MAMLAGTFAAPAQLDEGRVYFSVAAEQTVLPGRAAPVRVQAQGVRQLEFRLYRVREPRAFFLKLDSASSFGAARPRRPGARTPIEKFAAWKSRQRAKIRNFFRMQFSAKNRAVLRAWLQKRSKKPRTPAEAAPEYAGVPVLNPEQLVKRWTQPLPAGRPWETATVEAPLAEAGVYVLEATDQQRQAYTVLIATPLAVLGKSAAGTVTARVTDRISGAPRAGCSLEVLDPTSKQAVAKGRSDANGAATFSVPGQFEENLVLLADCGGVPAAAQLAGFSLSPRWRGMQGAVHTDRPVYRPGQTVHFRAIVREERGADYALPDAGRARVTVEDATGNPIYQKSLSFTKYGTVRGDFRLPEDAPLGYFGIRVVPEGTEEGVYGGFHVEEYRKPEYDVKVTPEAARTLQGGRAKALIQARYFFGEPVAGAAVEWSVERYRWYPPWWQAEEEFEPEEEEESFGGERIFAEKGYLNESGELEIAFPLERGEHDYIYRIEAQVTDAGGRAISGAGSFLATRAPFLITARAEKWAYVPGETVRWRVTARNFDEQPVAGVRFRVELYHSVRGSASGPRLLEREGVTGEGGDAVVEFPAPRGGGYVIRTVAMSPQWGELREEGWMWISGAWSGEPAMERVRLALDKPAYQPGETARVLVVTGAPRADVWVTVEGTGLHGSQFVRAEGGTATVEIPIRPEYAPNVFVKAVFVLNDKLYTGEKLLKVPPTEKQIFVELTPSRKLFQPGENAEFRLTARDDKGRPLRAEFALAVVDEAIYAIRREAQPDLVKIFYGRRWNRVNTSTSQSYFFYGEAGTRRMELARRAGPPWRAQLKREEIAEPKIRKDFPDTAFWASDLETDAQGRAEARFAFPDSLTTWRATARGVTVDTRVGGAVARVLVRKDVIVSMAAPRFFAEGDEAEVPVLVRNYTSEPQQARVSLRAQGVQIVSGQETDVEVPPQAEARVDYRLKAEAEGEAVLTASAKSRGGSDAVEIRLPVHPYGVPMSAAAQERIDGGGRRVLAFDFPPEAGNSGRAVEVRLTPSLAGSLFGALEYLVTYPYGCTEQVMSSFLPNLVVAEALRRLKLEAQVDRRELDRNVKAGLEKLAGYQNEDGSWGWWSEDEGDVFLTSYVLLGLSHARENGYAVPQWRRDQAAGWLMEQLRKRKADADTHAYAVLALAMDRKPGEDLLAAAWARRQELSGFGWAALGLALQKAGDGRRHEAAAALALLAREEGQELYWPSRRDPMFGREAEHTFEATAMAVRFLAAEKPDSPQIERAVRWLLAHRDRGYYWGSTKRTAFVVYGLTPVLERSGQLRPDFTARVLADGREVLRRRFTAEDALAAKPVRVEAPAPGRHSEVRVEMEGSGTLYVSANWRWRLAEPGEARVRPENSPLRIERRYWRLRAVQAGGRVEYEMEPWSGAARRGELVAVHIRVTGANLMNALVVEDPLPAGAEPVGRADGLALRGVPKWWQWWHARRELRDNRVLWFPWRVPERGFDAVYLFRFTNAGRFRVSPARVEPMYEPGVAAWSEAAEWEVLP